MLGAKKQANAVITLNWSSAALIWSRSPVGVSGSLSAA
jgi:hypothetical protein